jgi:hypothetical protein
MATVSCARLQEHKARDRCALCATRCAELDDLNLHVKSPLANDLASRFGGMEHFSIGSHQLSFRWL